MKRGSGLVGMPVLAAGLVLCGVSPVQTAEVRVRPTHFAPAALDVARPTTGFVSFGFAVPGDRDALVAAREARGPVRQEQETEPGRRRLTLSFEALELHQKQGFSVDLQMRVTHGSNGPDGGEIGVNAFTALLGFNWY